MKYPTLQKVVLTTMALVASLALSAQAGTTEPFRQRNKRMARKGEALHFSAQASNASWHRMLFPTATYMVDDGISRRRHRFEPAAATHLRLNKFAVIPGNETITTVSIAWGTPAFPDPSLNGLPYTVGIWSDPNGDGNPTDAVLLDTAAGHVSPNRAPTPFVTYILSTPRSRRHNFFVGFLIYAFCRAIPGGVRPDITPPLQRQLRRGRRHVVTSTTWTTTISGRHDRVLRACRQLAHPGRCEWGSHTHPDADVRRRPRRDPATGRRALV